MTLAQPPSFPFYPADWIAGTARMSLAEKGAYIDALAHQWHADEGLPTNPVEVARIIRATPAEARKSWPAVAKKFTETADGLRNDRLEKVRAEKRAYSASQANNGRRSAEARAQRSSNNGSTNVKPAPVQPSGNSSLLSSSSSTPVTKNVTGVGDARGPALMCPPRVSPGSPAEWDRIHGRHTHGFCDWFCLPADVFGQLATRLGGEAEAMAFAKRVRARFESSVPKGVPSGRPWEFWERQLSIEFPPEAAPSRTPDALSGVREALRRV